jgi:hypothetical protein
MEGQAGTARNQAADDDVLVLDRPERRDGP